VAQTSDAGPDGSGTAAPRVSLRDLARVFLRISLLGFGGPSAHIALMLDEVVEKRRWVTREHFLELVAVTNLLPGPNSSELAIHLGYTQRGVRGGLASGLAFLLPTFVIITVLSALYFRLGALPAVEGLFWGLKPMIVAIIMAAGFKLGRAAVSDALLGALAALGVVVAIWLQGGELAAMAAGGLVGWIAYGRDRPAANDGAGTGPLGAAPALLLLAGSAAAKKTPLLKIPMLALPMIPALALGTIGKLFWLTLWTGSVLFGGGYMLVALIEPYVVGQYGWLTAGQFLDGIALTQSAPGPIVMLVTFVGYAVAGVAGATVATVGIYLPSFAAVFVVAPFLERWRRIDALRAVLKGVNAVAAGAIIGVAVALGRTAVPDVIALVLLAAALVASLRFGVGAAWLVVAGLLAGLTKQLLLLAGA